MYKIKSLVVLLALIFCQASTLQAQKSKSEVRSIYMFGFSASFSDSLIYITDIQRVDSVRFQDKSGLLMNRTSYSNQLQFYLEREMNRPKTTCVTFCNEDLKKLQKERNEIWNKYSKDRSVIVKTLTKEQFEFEPENYDANQ